MGRLEKIVVVVVLFLVAAILGVSLSNGDEAEGGLAAKVDAKEAPVQDGGVDKSMNAALPKPVTNLGQDPSKVPASPEQPVVTPEIGKSPAPVVTRTAADGYRLTTQNVAIDLRNRQVVGSGGVSGAIPSGTFSAERISADLDNRVLMLDGNVRMRFVQTSFRMPQ